MLMTKNSQHNSSSLPPSDAKVDQSSSQAFSQASSKLSGEDQEVALPSGEQVKAYLITNAAQAPNPWLAWGPLGLLVAVFIFTLSSTSPAAMLLPWLALGGVMITTSLRVKRMKELEVQANAIQELAMLRQFRKCFDLAWLSLPRLVRVPELHGRTVAVIAHVLDQLKARDSAIVGYSFLIYRLHEQHPAGTTLKLHRAIAQLANEQLADADDSLRRMRHLENDTDEILPLNRGLYILAKLYQIVQTRHYDDALEMASDVTDALRPLGVDAGLGHAFVASAFHEMAQRATVNLQSSGHASFAQGSLQTPDQMWAVATQHWSDATLLLPVGELIDRYESIATLASVPLFAEACLSAVPPRTQQ